MTDKQTPPDWVLLEAAKRSKCGEYRVDHLRKRYHDTAAYRALCDALTAPPIEPPVDRKLLCAREAMARNTRIWDGSDNFRSGEMDDGLAIADCIRAIELWEEGFGK